MEICEATRDTAGALNRRAGWSNAEETLLFERAAEARRRGRPLKSVFDEVASATGRKPNSVRNYYYARVRQEGDNAACSAMHSAAFEPFAPQEVRELVRKVLAAQSGGMSVRACTMEMGDGDTRRMLRYQNKYRAVIKNDPELVRSVIEEMRGEGLESFDPYAAKPERAAAQALGKSEAAAFFEALEALAARYKRLVT